MTRRRATGIALAAALCLGACLPAKAHGYESEARVTHYDWTGHTMASGDYPFVGAVATNALPLYSWVITPDGLWWQVLDRCGGCGSVMWLDFYGFCAECVYGSLSTIEVVE